MTANKNLPDFRTFGLPDSLKGFHFPAEWAPHTATWLSWPHKEESWPGKIATIYKPYCEFIKAVSEGELFRINVVNEKMAAFAKEQLQQAGVELNRIEFFEFTTNDAWCRDHGPAFLINTATKQKVIVDWGYNAWGNKYPPYNLDDAVPQRVAELRHLPLFSPDIVMEGGSIDVN